MKIDCPHCAGLGSVLVAGMGSKICGYCKGLGSVAMLFHSKKEKVFCYICGKRIYDRPYQFLLKGFEDKLMFAHRTKNEDGLECKKRLDEAKRQRNFRLLPDGPLKEAFYESKKKASKQPSAFIPH